MKQRQFLDVVSDAEASRRIAEATAAMMPRAESVPLDAALDRVLFDDLRAAVDVPGFDRSDVDGFAVRSADVVGAAEMTPSLLEIGAAPIAAGDRIDAAFEVKAGTAVAVATGARLPRGADAVVMIEDALPDDDGRRVAIQRSVAPGANLSSAGSDLGRGEIVLRAGCRLGSRETALIAAVGCGEVLVHARPLVVVFSTGNEVVPPGESLSLGQVHDSNSRAVGDAARELGAAVSCRGILKDDAEQMEAALLAALVGDAAGDLVILSGGTSKGAGDLAGQVLAGLAARLPASRGTIVHGVSLKPGKPFAAAILGGKPVFVLPGFPTSAIFTFHEFVAPLLRRLTGRGAEKAETIEASLAHRVRSAVGRTEYLLVDLVEGRQGLAAYPLGSGSGSVSTFSAADGWIRIPREVEQIEESQRVTVRALGRRVRRPDLTVIGSHCVGLDALLSALAREGWDAKSIAVGSQGGLMALERGEGDLAGTHLFDPASGRWNLPFLPPGTRIVAGWGRRQGLVFRRGDPRFTGLEPDALLEVIRSGGYRMVNRNRGSGTRILIDQLLRGSDGTPIRPPGYHDQARSHHAVAAAVAQGRADWGMTLDVMAEAQGLTFVFVKDERFDLAAIDAALEKPALSRLIAFFADGRAQRILGDLGFVVDP